jgi:divalent metal cation (Fe/Co/Zn/Cd) transporter
LPGLIRLQKSNVVLADLVQVALDEAAAAAFVVFEESLAALAADRDHPAFGHSNG